MKIPGIVYLFVGCLILGVSFYITTITKEFEPQKFMIFMWIGGIFSAIGLFKISVGFLGRPKKPKVAKENFPHHNPNRPGSNIQHAPNQLVKFCSKCGGAVRHFDNYCFRCGNRIFHHK